MVNQTKFVFAEPFFADEVRIYPISFHGDKVFRVELYGCYLGNFYILVYFVLFSYTVCYFYALNAVLIPCLLCAFVQFADRFISQSNFHEIHSHTFNNFLVFLPPGRVTIPSPIGVNNRAKISIDRSQDSSLQDYRHELNVVWNLFALAANLLVLLLSKQTTAKPILHVEHVP